MSLAKVEKHAPIRTVQELKEAINDSDRRAIDFVQELRENEPKQVEFAQQQGRDKAQHFIDFVLNDEEEDKAFWAYFMKDDSHHVFQHEGFWHELSSTFVDIETVEIEGTDQKHHIFPGTGVFLKEEVQRYESGEVFAVRYTAHHSESAKELGGLAAAHAMQ